VADDDDDDLRSVFDFVRFNEWTTAEEIASVITGGPSRAKFFLYKYKYTLFEMRGLSQPQWRVVSADALSRVLPQVNVLRLHIKDKSSPYLPSILNCGACGHPIQHSGKCGCS